MIKELKRLLDQGHNIAIITGSGKDYIIEQVPLIHSNLTLLPCNGTQIWQWMLNEGKDEWYCNHKEELDPEIRAKLHAFLEQTLSTMKPELPKDLQTPTGEVIQHRPSMINFCPIGRGADQVKRDNFQQVDIQSEFRQRWLPVLRVECKKLGFTAVMGGVTSFDIFPEGWDKTYSLKKARDTIFRSECPLLCEGILFIGNSFFTNGNDACMLNQQDVICMEVKNPDGTLEILRKIK